MEPNPSDFQQKLHDIKRRFSRGRSGDVWGIGIGCSFLISQSPMIEVVRVKKPMADPYLIIALCRVRSGEFSAQQLSGELKHLWTNEIWPSSFGQKRTSFQSRTTRYAWSLSRSMNKVAT